MRVGVIGPQYADSFADNIADCLPDLGVQVDRLGPERPSLPGRLDQAAEVMTRALLGVNERLQRRLVRRSVDQGCEVVISVTATLLPKTVALLRRNGIKVILWFPDHVSNLGLQMMMVADYHRIYFKDPLLVDRLRSLVDAPIAYLPEACNPHWHRPIGIAGSVPEIVIAGNMYPTRLRLLDRLHADGVPLRLYGSRPSLWVPDLAVMTRHTNRRIARSEKAAIYRSAAAVLNNLHPSEMFGVNCRTFEAAGCGAVVLCEERPTLRDFFEIGPEILAFRTYEDLLRQCQSLLEDPIYGRGVGDAAAARAHAEHTYQLRLKSVLEDCAA